jgi:hypothetical protein
MEQGFAKELSIGRVNESVRGQNSREIGERLSGSEKKTAALEFIAFLLKTRSGGVDRLTGQFPGLHASARDDVVRLSGRSSLRRVIGLTKFKGKCVDEVGACAQTDAWGTIFE